MRVSRLWQRASETGNAALPQSKPCSAEQIDGSLSLVVVKKTRTHFPLWAVMVQVGYRHNFERLQELQCRSETCSKNLVQGCLCGSFCPSVQCRNRKDSKRWRVDLQWVLAAHRVTGTSCNQRSGDCSGAQFYSMVDEELYFLDSPARLVILRFWN